tara:strand:+ start:6217 stop:6363 length:147 start_codon:yes stop_codon:yes gene_type:complete
MGRKSVAEARKVSKVYTTEELLELLKKNEQFTVNVINKKKKGKTNNGH